MDQLVYEFSDLSVIKRNAEYFVRYDAGAHQVVMREDKISESEAIEIQSGEAGIVKVLFCLQKRLIALGIDPYTSNFKR